MFIDGYGWLFMFIDVYRCMFAKVQLEVG